MTEDWAEVARAIKQRMAELGLTQRELIARSQVSKAIVGELQHNTVQRRRSDRTLEALSIALDWHPNHLVAVLAGHTALPQVGEPVVRSDDDLPGRLAAIEHQLREINAKLARIDSIGEQVAEIRASFESAADSAPSANDLRRE